MPNRSSHARNAHAPFPTHCGLTVFPRSLATAAFALFALAMTPAYAAAPGRGLTAQFEQTYLTFIIDHHYSALRMTELAAGTDTQRDPPVNNPDEGTSPTPGTTATPAKANMEEIKSMARMANRMQREEIVKAQRLLQEWYGATHTPSLSAEGLQQIQLLEQTPAGEEFEKTFLQVFSNHHYGMLQPSIDCQVKADVDHHELKTYCEGMVHTQLREIDEMRDMLCAQFAVCDYQPGAGIQMQSSTAAGSSRR